MLRYNLRTQIIIQAADALVVVAALWLSLQLRLAIPLGMDAPIATFTPPPALYGLAILIWLFAYRLAGVYAVQPGDRPTQALWRILVGQVFAVLMLMGVLYLGLRDFSRLQVVYILALTTIGAFAVRLALWPIQRRNRALFSTRQTALIVGEGEVARRAAQAVAEAGDAGLNLAGIMPDDSASLDGLVQRVRDQNVDEVLIAVDWFDPQTSARIQRILRLLEAEPVNVRVAIDYRDLAYFYVTPEDFHGVTLLGLRQPMLTPGQRLIKRAFDLVFSALVLLLTWPLLLIVALAIRLDSPGPAIFRQPRVGHHMRPFTIYKFRTMIDGAETMTDEELRAASKRPGDPRITRVGAFLRRTSLDELPQFINVLRGEMSVIGPRPELVSLAAEYEWWQRKRFEVPQGITGWWQVNGRSDRPMQEHIEDDLYYVRNYSLRLDLQILFRTVAAVLTGRGAY